MQVHQLHNEQLIGGRYLLQRLVRRCKHVELFNALDTQLDRPVTVQMLTDEATVNATLAETFLRHQQAAASIHNCPILTVYDAGTWDGRPYAVMERDKGRSPAALRRPGYPPDVLAALWVAWQVADALRCCREAGLDDWTFAPEAVSVDAEGNGCLAIVEGLGGPYSSAHAATDAVALGALLRLMLAGNAGPTPGRAAFALLPESVRTLLTRMGSGAENGLRTAGEVARAIEIIERAAYQPTEAYTAVMPPETGAAKSETTLLPTLEPPWEAPTLAAASLDAPVLAATVEAEPVSIPYLPPPEPLRQVKNGPPRWLSLLSLGSAWLLLFLLLLPSMPGLLPASAGLSATLASAGQPQQIAVVPDLRGKSLKNAQSAVGAVGLNLALGHALHDARAARGTVARQEPGPWSQVQAGSLVTVSLSLGPEPTPTAPPSSTRKEDGSPARGWQRPRVPQLLFL